MAKRDSANLVLNVRRDSKQRALQEALQVPWHLLEEGAAAFAEWHMIILWVRVITETADQVPEIVRSALQSRCPGFADMPPFFSLTTKSFSSSTEMSISLRPGKCSSNLLRTHSYLR